MVKGFFKIMDGTEIPVPYAQANKTEAELKLEEKNDVRYCTLLLAMDSKGKAFSKVANAKPANQPKGCLKKANDELKAAYAPNNTMEIMTLKNEFTDCALKNGEPIQMNGSMNCTHTKCDWELWALIFQMRT